MIFKGKGDTWEDRMSCMYDCHVSEYRFLIGELTTGSGSVEDYSHITVPKAIHVPHVYVLRLYSHRRIRWQRKSTSGGYVRNMTAALYHRPVVFMCWSCKYSLCSKVRFLWVLLYCKIWYLHLVSDQVSIGTFPSRLSHCGQPFGVVSGTQWVEHGDYNVRMVGLIPGATPYKKMYSGNDCTSLWIKASAKCELYIWVLMSRLFSYRRSHQDQPLNLKLGVMFSYGGESLSQWKLCKKHFLQ